jgi:protein-disulfide isomerase/predicted small lipoprotein YifL
MRRTSSLAVLAVVAAAAACSRSRGPVSAPPAPSTADPKQVVAEVDGKPITRGELDQKAAESLVALRQQEYDTLRQALEQMIGERLIEKEAAARHLSKEALLKSEADDRVPAPDPARVAAVYEQNKQRFRGQTLVQMTPDITRAIRQQDVNARRQAFAEELRKKASVRVALEPPRAQVAIPGDAPVLGPAQAPVTVVEFSDYQCPYCRRAQSVVDEIVGKYQGKIRLVVRDFPLEGHPRAMPAARAAHCADEQGKFWDYHHALLTQAGDFSDDDFKTRAAALGLDPGKFETCLQSPRHDEKIQASIADGARIGVSGTPAFFINGRMLFGARPVEQFQEVIDAELAAAR